MMNSNLLLELARQRNCDLIEEATRRRQQLGPEQRDLPASEQAFLIGHSALAIDARVRARARLRVRAGAFEAS